MSGDGRSLGSRSAFAATDPKYDTYDALRDVVTTRSRVGDRRGESGHVVIDSGHRRYSAEAEPPVVYDGYLRSREPVPEDEAAEEAWDVVPPEPTPPPPHQKGRSLNCFGATSEASSAHEENPSQPMPFTVSSPLEDVSPTRGAAGGRERLDCAVTGCGVGNLGVAVRGELATFQVMCRTQAGEAWHWKVGEDVVWSASVCNDPSENVHTPLPPFAGTIAG